MSFVNGLTKKIARITRFRWVPWVIVGVIFFVALSEEILQPPWLGNLSRYEQAVVWSLALVLLMVAYLIVDRAVFFLEERERDRQRAEEAEASVKRASQRLEAIFRLSQKFVEASDEDEIVELVLRIVVDLVGATGAAFVPLDEHGQPQTSISLGELPAPAMQDWVEYLATPAVRDRCNACENYAKLNTDRSCPLIKGPFANIFGVFCLPLHRGEREYGVLNLFISQKSQLDNDTQAFLQALMDETALALEGVHLRRREMNALRQMQAVRQKTDLPALLNALLEDVHLSLESDFAILMLCEPNDCFAEYNKGDIPNQARVFLQGVMQGVMASREALLLGDVASDPASNLGVRSVIAAPLFTLDRNSLGALLVANRRIEGFHQRQLSLLQTVAGQVALIVENANQMADLEYKILIQERTRLAREIHDGLAQTLGFLKLQVAQMQSYLARKDEDRLRQSMSLCYNTLSEAYQDARQSIDGLRISPSEQGVTGWLEQSAHEFQELSGLVVDLEEVQVYSGLLPEVQAQLIRIVQEALSNVRKHAQARHVTIVCREVENDLWLEIKDDGVGFSPEDVSGPSQHGLQGMRERAELIGADFQVASRTGQGTSIRIRLPLTNMGDVQNWYLGEVNP
jgi:two-component system nitrate/nitrite sensor histidine kinase NarX